MSVTVSTVMFGEQDPGPALAASPGWSAAIRGATTGLSAVSPAGRQQVERELAAAGGGLLGLDLREVLVAAWRRHRALYAAAKSTKDSPATEVVQLATHRITTTHRPSVDVAVNGVRLATVHFELSLVIEVDGLSATVRGGRLVGLGGGRCVVTAALGCAGQDLLSRQAVLDPSITVPLGDGIALMGESS
jgi:hypothetical protein